MTSVRSFDIRAMCEVYGASADDIEVLIGLAAAAKQDGWWHAYGEAIPEWFELYVVMESTAQSIFKYEAELIPGLLQTYDYAFAMLRAEADFDDAEIDERVAVRRERQRILSRRVAPDLDVVLSEGVSRRTVGGRSVTASQLAHLVFVSDRSNVRVRVLPFDVGEHMAMINPFSYLHFREPGEPDVIYIETRTGALFLEKPKERRSYHAAMRAVSEKALSEDASREMIAAVAREFAT